MNLHLHCGCLRIVEAANDGVLEIFDAITEHIDAALDERFQLSSEGHVALHTLIIPICFRMPVPQTTGQTPFSAPSQPREQCPACPAPRASGGRGTSGLSRPTVALPAISEQAAYLWEKPFRGRFRYNCR